MADQFFMFCPSVNDDGWVAHPVTGDPHCDRPSADRIIECASCGARIAHTPGDHPEMPRICERHLDEPWPPTLRASGGQPL